MALNLQKMIMRMDESRVLTKFIKVMFLLCRANLASTPQSYKFQSLLV